MAIALKAAFQHNGAFQLASQGGFQTQYYNVWNPVLVPSHPITIWTPINKPSGPWTPLPKSTGIWRPT